MSSGHLTSSKRSSGGFFTKESRENAVLHEPQQVHTIVRSGECISTNFVFLEHFAWSCEISFHFSPGVLQPKPILFHFAWLCEFFACSCEIEKQGFPTLFCNFFHFFILISLQLPPNPNPNRLHCFFHYAFGSSSLYLFLQFDSSLLSSIYQKHTLKWLQNFIKLVSNSYKGNNMLIECFRHNYYSKDVKLMRIII